MVLLVGSFKKKSKKNNFTNGDEEIIYNKLTQNYTLFPIVDAAGEGTHHVECHGMINGCGG